MDGQDYKIIRIYRDMNTPTRDVKGQNYLTLDEAQEHCRRDDTRKEGVWFDGYTKM